jgi:hypothetical protein
MLQDNKNVLFGGVLHVTALTVTAGYFVDRHGSNDLWI